ncbi:MAG TPA: potassium channel protein [Flavisolibacter sp.]|jgi:voltage-gated potassium channel|nr:potassium channel protein [Flavisolibacter sp.]
MPRFNTQHPFRKWLLLLVFVLFFGVAGYMIIEDYSFFDALYMAVITIATIGYHEVKPLSDAGKAFNIVFIIASFVTFTYVLARITQSIANGDLAYYFTKKRLMQDLEKMQNHVIVCGYGRNGQQAAKTLRAHKIPYVIIEKNDEAMRHHKHDDPSLVYLSGDATEDDLLIRAGVERARAILISLPEDADNVFIVLSARSLNSNIHIVSRASHQTATAKLYKAGANNVVMPDMIGGTHMATLVSKPDVIEFIDFLSGEDGEAIHIEAVGYNKLPAPIRDKTLKQIMDWKRTGVNCIGVKDENGKFCINPPEDIVISQGMKVIILGTKDQIAEMKKNVGEV